MAKLGIDPYKGVRDFYPEDMVIQNYIFNVWHKTVKKFGYVEYSASLLEPTEIYTEKSGAEIVNEQTFTFTDRGNRSVTLRPEMTPTLARMIAARRRNLKFPLRWYSIPNLFRYERPQRGRRREHWQLNCDLLGIAGIEADKEIVSLAYTIMKEFGAKDEDFEIRINNSDINNFKVIAPNLVLDPTLARGQTYYTGIVFEIFDISKENGRALAGGGRYDNLLEMFDVEPLPAVGFGMGDIAIRDSLTDSYYSYVEEELPKLWPILERADMLIGFNSDHFDIPLLNKYYPGDLIKIRSLDILKEIKDSYGRRMRLDQLAEGTLGKNKTGHGDDAITWWKVGDVEKVRAYCLNDVKLTKELYDYALVNNSLTFKEGNALNKIKLDTSEWEKSNNHKLTFSLPF